MIKNILFDLDGTLTDSSEGIFRCIEYALEKMSIKIPERPLLKKYIGPPLIESFREMLGTDDDMESNRALLFYRERYKSTGMFENSLYDGVPDMLSELSKKFSVFLCTSKPEIFASQILDHFNIKSYFNGVYGSSLDGTHVEKDSLIAHLLKSEMLAPEATAMIGDRIYDIEGARVNSVRPYAVSYGFGHDDEFKNAARIFVNTQEIKEHFTNGGHSRQ